MEPLDTKQIIEGRKRIFLGKTGKSFDKLLLGIVLGAISPAIAVILYWLAGFNRMTLKGFYLWAIESEKASAILSLCLLSNLLVFFIFIWTHRNESARGVLMSTFIYALPVLYLKFFA